MAFNVFVSLGLERSLSIYLYLPLNATIEVPSLNPFYGSLSTGLQIQIQIQHSQKISLIIPRVSVPRDQNIRPLSLSLNANKIQSLNYPARMITNISSHFERGSNQLTLMLTLNQIFQVQISQWQLIDYQPGFHPVSLPLYKLMSVYVYVSMSMCLCVCVYVYYFLILFTTLVSKLVFYLI